MHHGHCFFCENQLTAACENTNSGRDAIINKKQISSGAALFGYSHLYGGMVSVPGVYAGSIHGFLFGDAFDNGLTFKMGQTHVHKFLPQLLEFIENGDLSPEVIITHRMNLANAAEG